MIIQILEILFFSFLLNFVLYLVYRYYISRKISQYLLVLEDLNSRINKVTSKRRERVYRKLSKDIRKYNSGLYFYSMLQSFALLGLYILGLFLIFTMRFTVYIPFYIPVLTQSVSSRHVILEGPILVYILSFLLFTPLSLRRPKANIN
ncbi:hypothetical protein HA72_0116 [Metallosphaera sedula]|uniref:Uncharacterized protein n=3 Tax=Metallosphaera TaxID=41980 RepID=A4YCZ1_METS5|nr:hypothetical protein Msed_0116 [Metallosphaera sedula DSM 5348]AIM26280.1 hypothetical protein HA72_0116 [Metallosphaera sedula]QCO30116.1 hypothetical protein DFR88_06085 [Metallosphaera prunae]AKV73294.1 hypothetical protein MsedA_0120 [Metallosphaera sedula]AKV75538.1 hypothetical protein MsedB_0120 [Metallosphaera sedula]